MFQEGCSQTGKDSEIYKSVHGWDLENSNDTLDLFGNGTPEGQYLVSVS